jgi:hypothetical protein
MHRPDHASQSHKHVVGESRPSNCVMALSLSLSLSLCVCVCVCLGVWVRLQDHPLALLPRASQLLRFTLPSFLLVLSYSRQRQQENVSVLTGCPQTVS